VTHDDDLSHWHNRGAPHAGIAFCHLTKRTLGQFVEMLMLMPELVAAGEAIGQVQFPF
jgi:hypothetical protein